MLSASSSYHLVPFLGTPCLNLVKLSQPLNALAAFRVSVHHFCSETVTVDQNFDCDGRSGIEDESLESDVDKFCETNDFVSVSLPKDSPLFGTLNPLFLCHHKYADMMLPLSKLWL
ncbi:unnamed protein product [Prunus armeniaca]